MRSGLKWILGIVAVISIIFIWGIGSYNGLVSSEQQVDTAKSNIETQLQRRSDLIPNLVSTVKGYASQEKEFLLILQTQELS